MNVGEMQEFKQLKSRFLASKEYEKAKYMTDPPEIQDRAIKTLKNVMDRMGEIWTDMNCEQKKKESRDIWGE